MSCDTSERRGALAAAKNGVAALAGKKAFYLGLALAGTALGGGLWLARRRPGWALASPAMTPPPLPGQERVAPLRPDQRGGRPCAGCRVASKPGPWYDLRGRVYCQDCAPEAARAAHMTLAAPAPGAFKPSLSGPRLPPARRVTLKPRSVPVGPLHLDGFAVTAQGQETGLSLLPDYKVDDSGEVQVNRTRWFVHYDRVGRAIAGPFESVNQAKGMAALLAHLDWTRPVEEFSNEDIVLAVKIGNRFRENIEFEKCMQQINNCLFGNIMSRD